MDSTVSTRVGIAVRAALTGTAVLLASAAGAAETASTAASQPGQLEEVVVTGLKREQSIVEAPVAVSVFTAEDITRANITRPGDYLAQVPNVTFYQSNHAGEAFVNIRGQPSVRQAEASVAVVIDGVQLATQNEFNGELFDIQQIEVLKGPQGALYGRNASAGAIIITTRQPSDEFEGSATLGYGNFNSARAVASISGPFIPGKLRFRVSGAIRSTDGPFRSDVSGEDVMRSSENIGRAQLEWLPTEDLRVDVRVNGSRLRGGAIAFNAQADIPGFPLCGTVGPINADATDSPWCSNVQGENRQSKSSESVKIDWTTPFGTLTSVTAYNQISDIYQADNFPYIALDSGTPGGLTQKYRIDNDAFSQELRFASKDSKVFSWMVGAYYLDAKRRFTQIQGQDVNGTISPSLTPLLPGSSNPTTSFFDTKYPTTDGAVFANAQWRPVSQFEIGLAGRYDRERRRIEDLAPGTVNPVTGRPYSTTAGQTAARTFTAFTPKVTLTWLPTDAASVYVSYGKGFKSGGFNPFGTRATLLAAIGDPNLVFVQDSYDKETSKTKEIGFKSQWFANRLSVNGAYFQTDVDGAQQFEFFPSAGLQAVSQIDRVKIKGYELEVHAQPADGLTVVAGYGHISNPIEEFRANPAFVGNRAPYVANYNAMLAVSYSADLSPDLQLNLRADANRTGEISYVVQAYPGSVRSPVTLANARVGLTWHKTEFALWSRNLSNKKYNSDVVPLLPVLQAVYRAFPRTYGAEVTYRF
jgi:iron complex outermembrane receptor protein